MAPSVDELLSRPFREVIQEWPALREYLAEQGEDEAEVTQQFEEHWHAEAPDELRVVLLELLGEADEGADEEDEDSEESTGAGPLGRRRFSVEDLEEEGPNVERAGRGDALGSYGGSTLPPPTGGVGAGGPSRDSAFVDELESALQRRRPQAEEVEAEEELPAVGDTGVDLGRIDELLQLSFDEALREWPELRDYIAEQDDAAAVEQEFRENWHPEAPALMREVMEELLLGPELAKKAAEETARFAASMRSRL